MNEIRQNLFQLDNLAQAKTSAAENVTEAFRRLETVEREEERIWRETLALLDDLVARIEAAAKSAGG